MVVKLAAALNISCFLSDNLLPVNKGTANTIEKFFYLVSSLASVELVSMPTATDFANAFRNSAVLFNILELR